MKDIGKTRIGQQGDGQARVQPDRSLGTYDDPPTEEMEMFEQVAYNLRELVVLAQQPATYEEAKRQHQEWREKVLAGTAW